MGIADMLIVSASGMLRMQKEKTRLPSGLIVKITKQYCTFKSKPDKHSASIPFAQSHLKTHSTKVSSVVSWSHRILHKRKHQRCERCVNCLIVQVILSVQVGFVTLHHMWLCTADADLHKSVNFSRFCGGNHSGMHSHWLSLCRRVHSEHFHFHYWNHSDFQGLF